MTTPQLHVSVCLLAENEADALARALASVKELAAELVVVDLDSRDGGASVAEAAGARVLHATWQGSYADLWNQALEAATGEWILFMAANEELLPGSVATLKAALETPRTPSLALRVVARCAADGQETLQIQRRLFRRDLGARFVGNVEEELQTDAPVELAEATILQHQEADSPAAQARLERQVTALFAAMEREPQEARWPAALAHIHFTARRLGEARLLAEKALALGGTTPPAGMAYIAAACALEHRDDTEALKAAADGLAVNPEDIDLYAILVGAHHLAGRAIEGEAAARRFLALADDFVRHPLRFSATPINTLTQVPYVHVCLGLWARERGDLDAMIDEMTQASDTASDPAMPLLHAAQVLLKHGNTEAAFDLLQRMAQPEHPACDILSLELAKLLLDTQQVDAARAILAEADTRRLSPDQRDYLEALIELTTDETEAAGAHFEALLERNPDHLDACLGLAVAYERLGDIDAAEQLFLAQIERLPEPFEMAINLANLYARNGRYADAVAFLEKVVEAQPARLDVAALLARLYWELSDADHLLKRGRLLGHELGIPDALTVDSVAGLGRLFGEIGTRFEVMESKSAAIALELARLLLPQDAAVAKRYAQSLLRLGFPQSACAAYEQALHLTPDDPDLFQGLAAAYRAQNAEAAALVAEDKAAELRAARQA